jgi:large subunit ribosomal protein L30
MPLRRSYRFSIRRDYERVRRVRLTLLRSRYGRLPKHRRTLEALGLRKIGQSVIKPDNPQIRGMARRVSYLIKIEEVDE